MITRDSISTKVFVSSNREIFEDIARSTISTYKSKEYTQLNYEMILDKMCRYIEGYISYKESGSNKYKGKVMNTTLAFYNEIFKDESYRHDIVLKDMPNISETFLKKTKELQELMEKHAEKQALDYELQQLLIMTDNQYKKVAKVFRDDMEIYLWLCTENSSIHAHVLDVKLRQNFKDPTTPVMHEKKNKIEHFGRKGARDITGFTDMMVSKKDNKE